MLAGPNGSGKSFLVPLLAEEVNLGVIVNADEIEATLRKQPAGSRLLNLGRWNVQLADAELQEFAARLTSQRLPKEQISQLRIEQNVLLLGHAHLDSYLAAWVAELLRFHLLSSRQSLTFETVMSHPSKLEFLRAARLAGYRTYLYFVATADPAINIARVAVRVAKGGHSVAQDKIVASYRRSLSLLRPALKLTDRAYIFDNSGTEPMLVAEVMNGKEVTFKTAQILHWVNEAIG